MVGAFVKNSQDELTVIFFTTTTETFVKPTGTEISTPKMVTPIGLDIKVFWSGEFQIETVDLT